MTVATTGVPARPGRNNSAEMALLVRATHPAEATLRGDRATNQDHVVILDGAAAVLDGATSWLHTHDQVNLRDGGWYARTLGHALSARLPGHGTTLPAILSAAIAEIRDAYCLQPGHSPYSTATIARWDHDNLELLVLGDSPALIREKSGPTRLISDDRLAATAPVERAAYRDHLRHGRGFDTAFAGLIAEVQRTERHSFNQPHGFWVAEAEPAAADHAVHRSLAIDDVDSLILMSDGAAAGVTDYALTDWTALVDELNRTGVATWLHRVHAAEESDPHGHRWPRTKEHDDKTIVTVTSI